ncbi:MAG TPA: hypothetical protein VN207_01130 [Ktedonobacteraceae bacterium]|nr:hypothetical protein [Ktedonobacteraceae bacterium]
MNAISDQQFFVVPSGTTYSLKKEIDPLLQIVTISNSAGSVASTLTIVPSPEELEEREWNRLLATPESDAFLDMLEEEALREYREGRTEEGGFGRD